MTDYTISSKLSNKTVYACYRGRFWHWNGSIWKESRIMTHRFELARAADKNLTPQAFLTNGAEFAPLDEYEIDIAMLDALENAKPCKNAPIEPVEEDSSSGVPAPCICSTCTCGGCKEECFGNCHSCGHPVQECNSYQTEGEKHLTPAHSADVDKPEVPGTQTAQDKPLTTVPDAMRPAFDYSGLTDQTVEDLHFAEDEYHHGKQLAERGLVHMGNAIAAAHDALCGTVVQQLDNGQFAKKDDTFRAWCCSIGITKSTAYNLLQVSALMDGSSPRQRAILEALPPTLLYAVAKPSAPAELVEKVKNGEVSTNKEYQDLLAQIKSKDAQLEAAHADISGLKDRATAAEAREEEAWSMVSKAQDEAKAAQENLDYEVSQNDALHEEKGQLLRECEAAKQARAEAEARAKDAENQLAGVRQVAQAAKLRGDKLKAENDALKSQPITAVVDKEETRRQAKEMADAMNAELQAKLNAVTGDAEQDVRNAYDSVLLASRAMLNTWQMVKPQFRKLPEEQREALANQIVHTIGSIQGEVTKCL